VSDSFYVTTPIYYVNDRPHIGHAYTTILADVLTRYHRMKGVPTYFLTGVDEHGQKVQQAAQKRGLEPQQHVDEMVVHFQDMAKRVGASNDDFIRTTEKRHTSVVQQLLQALFDKGEIYKKDYGGWYCEADEMFVQEKDLVDGLSPTGRPVEWVEETNYFFKMGQYQDWLIEYIEGHADFILPDYRANETLGFLKKQDLEDLCISRPKSRLGWGIPLPFDEDFVTYVWFDALTNYISAIGFDVAKGASDPAFAERWSNAMHLIGKDILTTHTVYWPTMLHAAGIPMPKTIFAHGWWLKDDSKITKTGGGALQPEPYIEQYGLDAFRYHVIADMALGQDTSFTDKRMNERYNADLVKNLGNGARRILELLKKNFDGVLPEPPSAGADEKALAAAAGEALAAYTTAFDEMKLHVACAEATKFCSKVNVYIDACKPWEQAKQDDNGPLGLTCATALEAIRVVSVMLYPIMPTKMTELRQCLGLGDAIPELAGAADWAQLTAGASFGSVALFPRIKFEEPKAEKDASEGKGSKSKKGGPVGVATTDQLSFDEFKKVQLCTAKVLSAEKIDGADKLLRLEIEVGAETRQLVAGVAEFYKPEELLGKTIVIVANLAPKKIRGVESHGMLLAARNKMDGEDQLRLVTLDGELPSGAPVS